MRAGKTKVRGSGFVVTWDVNSKDRSATNRLWAFLFGRSVQVSGRVYEYEGFVRRDGVRYLGQSVVFVLPHRLSELVGFLAASGIENEVDASIFP